MTARPKYRRVLLKASGEALMGEQHFGIDVSVVDRIAADIAEARAMGIEVGVVIGGGNIFRGLAAAARGALDLVLREKAWDRHRLDLLDAPFD